MAHDNLGPNGHFHCLPGPIIKSKGICKIAKQRGTRRLINLLPYCLAVRRYGTGMMMQSANPTLATSRNPLTHV